MALKKGIIALMGSGELTSTMVEVHKELLAGLGASPRAVFLDTPAGFQLNADQLSQKAVDYFRSSIKYPLSVASLKSAEAGRTYAAEKAFQALREAAFVLVGPGSPTYAVRQWLKTPVPDILKKRIEEGACLVAASAAALTVGCFTLPVYEIYKVGEELRWAEGMNVLGHFGLNLVVVPHWNNAEGGTHDTRFCYMGEARFRKLEAMLPEDVFVAGLDEHTACIIDFAKQEACVRGIGRVTVRSRGREASFAKGDRFSLESLRGGNLACDIKPAHTAHEPPAHAADAPGDSFWNQIHAIEEAYRRGIETKAWEEAAAALLDIDEAIWKAAQELENDEFIAQAREILRDMVVGLGIRLGEGQGNAAETLEPLAAGLIDLRAQFRAQGKWAEADGVRDCLARANIVIEDTTSGTQWRLKAEE